MGIGHEQEGVMQATGRSRLQQGNRRGGGQTCNALQQVDHAYQCTMCMSTMVESRMIIFFWGGEGGASRA